MTLPLTGKLVRDRIPEVIRDSGGRPETCVVSGEDLVEALHRKLEEESLELRQASEVDVREEIADVFEVLLSLAAVHGMSWSKIESAAAEKRVRRGGFSRGIWLLE